MRLLPLVILTACALPAVSSAQAPPLAGSRALTLVDTLVGAVGGVAVDRLGAVYVADFGETVYRVQPDGRVSVFATGLYGASGNTVTPDGDLLQASFHGGYLTRIDRHGGQSIVARGLRGPVGVAVDSAGAIYVNNCRDNSISRIAPGGAPADLARSDLLNCPNGLTVGPDGGLYVVNFSDDRVLRVSADGSVSVLARLPGGGNGHITTAGGALYATSFQGHRLYRVDLDGTVTPLAGTGAPGEQDGPAAAATFTLPNGIAAGPRGDRVYVNDYLNRALPGTAIPPTPLSSVRVVMLPTVVDAMVAALRDDGVEALAAAHAAFKADPATAAVYTEQEVNVLGYQLLAQGNVAAAVRVFEVNAEAYPASFNAWDSLAEGHMRAGRTEAAIRFYEKSLELNPGNANAVRMLEQLRGGAEPDAGGARR